MEPAAAAAPRRRQAVDSARLQLKLEQGRYDTGIDPYIDVVFAQTTVLADEQTLNNLQVQEMTFAVALVENLGGGWDRSSLPARPECCGKLTGNGK